jgi:hypothetical protein
MAYQIVSSSDEQEQNSAEASEFSVSAEPLIADRSAAADAAASQTANDLPRSYGAPVLTAMPRDPHSLFAYWDIDWQEVFRDGAPADRKVHLRVLKADGTEEMSVEIEPMAGSSYVSVREPDTTYSVELGYYQPASTWHSVVSSEAVTTPPAILSEGTAVDFATVPFHLSFQRMIDLFRVSKHESGSLTDMLAELRQRAVSPENADTVSPLTTEEQEIVRAIDAAIAQSPEPEFLASSSAADFGWQQQLERILGFGGSSPTNGFGGSSRAF